MHIGVDFDDVLYPYHEYFKVRILERFGIDLRDRTVTTFYYDTLPEFRQRGITRDDVWAEVQATWREVEAHAGASLMDPDAQHVLRELGHDHRITLVTARSKESFRLVESFLARHDIHPHEIRMGIMDKKGFDVLVDDFPKHAVENAAAGGHSLLYHIDENSSFAEAEHPRIHRVRSWGEVREAVARIAQGRTPVG